MFLVGCDQSFARSYESAIKAKTGQELFDELRRLDQAYPNQLKLKIDLGARSLASGDMKGAHAYLDRGEKLLGIFSDARLKYTLFTDQAELRLRESDYKASVSYAAKALAASKADELGVIFTKAKAENALKNGAAALRDFDAGWASHKPSMSSEDYRVYSFALAEAGRDNDALSVLDEYQKNYAYAPGIGLIESSCYERLGDMGSAILSSFKENGDLDYVRLMGVSTTPIPNDEYATASKLGSAIPMLANFTVGAAQGFNVTDTRLPMWSYGGVNYFTNWEPVFTQIDKGGGFVYSPKFENSLDAFIDPRIRNFNSYLSMPSGINKTWTGVSNYFKGWR